MLFRSHLMHKKSWQDRVKKPQEKKTKSPTLLILVSTLVVVALGAFVYVARMPEFNIKSVEVHNAVFTKESDIKDIVDSSLEGDYVFVIPKTNIWLYPKSEIRKRIFDAENSVTGVEITLSDGVLGLKLDERANNYVWCDGNHEIGRASCRERV